MTDGLALAREALERLVLDVHDYPEPGIVFKDITPLLADHAAFAAVVEALASAGRDADGNVVV
ncbi:MAG: adenine phosphoribosyltransferase, partial [Nocardioides sp.]